MSLSRTLRRMVADGSLRPIDAELALRLGAIAGQAEGMLHESTCLATLLASRAIEAGHSCVPAAQIAAEVKALPWPDAIVAPTWPADGLAQVAATGLMGDTLAGPPQPLICEHNRLYLQRYAALEAECARHLTRLLEQAPETVTSRHLDPADPAYLLAETDEKLEGRTNWQAVACVVALRHRLSVLSGGPGTGKTYTLALIALLLLERANAAGESYRIALAAPTGKAAQRLREALGGALAKFRDQFEIRDDDLKMLTVSGRTIHRLLGSRPRSIEFRHDAANPIDADCVIVDESSMVDLPLFTRLLRALKPTARLILVGDREQLFPVEAGSVFAELFALGSANHFDAATADVIEATTRINVRDHPAESDAPMAGHITGLVHSFRAEARIAGVAAAIQGGADGTGTTLHDLLVPGDHEASLNDVPREALTELIKARCAGPDGWFADLNTAATPEAALAALATLRILCAVRRGPRGVGRLNAAVEAALFPEMLKLPVHYAGRPVLVTRNDYRLRLFNGDVGIIFPDESGTLRAWFPRVDPKPEEPPVRNLPLSQLPPVDTCYAMTIHKSQGSEFNQVILILPDEGGNRETDMLTRELVYTGVTRARKSVEIWATWKTLQRALAHPTERYSGLAARLRELHGKQGAGNS